MTDSIINSLVETKRTVVLKVESRELKPREAAALLHLSRSGFWKLRSSYRRFGLIALTGRRRGPKFCDRSWNRVPETVEKEVVDLFYQYGVGPDRLVFLLDEKRIKIGRSTIYRILIRKKVLIPRVRGKRRPPKLYSKGFPGEEVQIDGTEPFGKGKGWSLSAVDDYSRYARTRFQMKNNSRLSAQFLKDLVDDSPFHVKAVRVDNGGEFKKSFVKMAKKLKVRIIRNPPHHPTSNGKVERFHRTLEEECYWRLGSKPDLIEANYWLSRYLGFYNERRRHQGFGMRRLTPKGKIEYFLNQETYYQEENVYLTVVQYKARFDIRNST